MTRSGTMTPSSDTEALTASCGTHLGVTDAVQRLGAEGLPAPVHGPCQPSAAGCNGRHASADLRKERRRFRSRRAVTHSADRAEPPAASGNRDETQALVTAPAMKLAAGNGHAGSVSGPSEVMIVLGVAYRQSRNQLCPSRSILDVPSSRFSIRRKERSHKRARSMVGLTTGCRLIPPPRTPRDTGPSETCSATDCDHLGDRLGDQRAGTPERSMDEGCRRAGY